MPDPGIVFALAGLAGYRQNTGESPFGSHAPREAAARRVDQKVPGRIVL